MSFSIQWPEMPKIGTVSIHAVGNQDYRTGFDVVYKGPKGRVTLYVNHYLTDDLNLAFMHRETNQYNYSPNFRVTGDAYEAEQAIRLFVENDGKLERPAGKRTTTPGLWSCYYGAAVIEAEAQKVAIGQLQNFFRTWQDTARVTKEAGFGLTYGELAEKELAFREERLTEVQSVLSQLPKLDSHNATSTSIISAVVKPELKQHLEGFVTNPITPLEETSRRFAADPNGGRFIHASTWGHQSSRLYAESLNLNLTLPKDEYNKVPTSLTPEEVQDNDILVTRVGSDLRSLERDMASYKSIQANPRLLLLSPNGNIEGRLADFTPDMFSAPQPGIKI